MKQLFGKQTVYKVLRQKSLALRSSNLAIPLLEVPHYIVSVGGFLSALLEDCNHLVYLRVRHDRHHLRELSSIWSYPA